MKTSTADQLPRLGFVGCGRLATALALGAAAAGYPVTACASRSEASANTLASQLSGCQAVSYPVAVADQSDWVFLTVPDDAIALLAGSIAWQPRHLALHCSGALPAAILRVAGQAHATAGFHPIQTFATSHPGPDALAGTTVGIEADVETYARLVAFATALHAAPLRIPADGRALYHLGCVLVSNFTVGLFAAAQEVWGRLGIDQAQAQRALLPLLSGTEANITAFGPAQALTGPLVRGDSATIAHHLEALRGDPLLSASYIAQSAHLLQLAEGAGRLSPGRVAELRDLLRAASATNRDAVTGELI